MMNNLKVGAAALSAFLPLFSGAAFAEEKEASFTLKPAPSFKSADGKTSFAIDGRVVADVGFVGSDDADLGNATDLRYLWAGFKGTVDKDWAFRFLVALENDGVDIKDAYLAYNGFDGVSLMAGNFRDYNGIENMTANLHMTFMERSSGTTTFRRLRSIGAGATFHGKQWSLQAGVFGDDPGNTAADDEGHSYSARFVAAPILDKKKDHVLHLGASISHRTPDADLDSVRFRARGESHVIAARLVDTGVIANVDNWLTYAGEARYTNGPFAVMGEYNVADVSRDTVQDVTFSGGYILVSFFLTGEQRGYNVKKGTYGRVKPKKPFSRSGPGSGAFEVAARYTNLDLNDGPILGGELNAYTLGFNWYPNSNVKFMVNYVFNDTDENATTPNNDPQFLMLRGQIDF